MWPLFFMFYTSFMFAGFHQIEHMIDQYLPENPVIIEAGAHDGTDTIKMNNHWPHATIYAFEPVPDIFTTLRNATADLPGIKRFDYALSSRTSKELMYVSGGGRKESSSLRAPKFHTVIFPMITFDTQIAVDSITLDDWATKEGVDHIDFLYLDMQGAEFDMLNASPNMLRTVKAIFTEVNQIELYAGCMLYPAYKTWLEHQGFTEVFSKLFPCDGNALFVRL